MGKHADEIIAMHLGWAAWEISGNSDSTRYSNPRIYSIGNFYFSAPANNMPPKNMSVNWECVAEYHGRKVYRANRES